MKDPAQPGGGDPSPSTLPAFTLLFSVSLEGEPEELGRNDEGPPATLPDYVTPFPPAQAEAYARLRDDADAHVLGKPFVDAQRLAHRPIGRMTLGEPDASGIPCTAEVHLYTHVSGVALWELWVPAPRGRFDVEPMESHGSTPTNRTAFRPGRGARSRP